MKVLKIYFKFVNKITTHKEVVNVFQLILTKWTVSINIYPFTAKAFSSRKFISHAKSLILGIIVSFQMKFNNFVSIYISKIFDFKNKRFLYAQSIFSYTHVVWTSNFNNLLKIKIKIRWRNALVLSQKSTRDLQKQHHLKRTPFALCFQKVSRNVSSSCSF